MNDDKLLNNSEMRYEAHLWASEFPLRFRKSTLNSAKHALNIHENVELLFFREGEGAVLCGDEKIPVRAGDIVAVNAYVAHQVETETTLRMAILIYNQDFCQSNDIDPLQLRFQRLVRGDQKAIELFQRVVDVYETPGRFQKAMIRCAAVELLLHMCVFYSILREERVSVRNRGVEYVSQAIQFMKENLSQKLSVDDIAASVGLSKYHFVREFKRITGYAPISFLNIIRCKRAKDLLEHGRHSVKEVAVLCGFSGNAHLTSVFKKHTGILPTQVQRVEKQKAMETATKVQAEE